MNLIYNKNNNNKNDKTIDTDLLIYWKIKATFLSNFLKW